MIGHSLPVFRGYSSQFGYGLGNVLGGVMRAAIPIVGKLAKKAGTQLLDTGIGYLQDRLLKRKVTSAPKLPAKRRKTRQVKRVVSRLSKSHKRRLPGKAKVSRSKPRRKGDIFDIKS